MITPATWRGEAASGELWIAFRGASADNRPHAHAALQLVTGAQVALVDADGCTRRGEGFAIRSGVRHQLLPNARLTLVLLEPHSPLARGLLAALAPDPVATLPAAWVRALEEAADPGGAVAALQACAPTRLAPLDARLRRALARLQEADAPCGVSALAAHCGISPARLRALAQAAFGVPLARLLLWRKVRRALPLLDREGGLAGAAAAAGFADQAHLTRALQRTIGLTPKATRAAAG